MNKQALYNFFLWIGLCATGYAQVGIGTTLPDAAAQLDIVSNDKGVLIPRIALKSSTDDSTISSGNLTSLLVYNTVTVENLVPGFYYWNGVKWHQLGSESEVFRNSNPPDADYPNNPDGGDLFINTSTGGFYVYDGSTWIASSTMFYADNGLYRATNGSVRLGGSLIEPTTVTASTTNTLALEGLEVENDLDELEFLVADKNTNVLKKTPSNSIVREEIAYIVATEGQSLFNPPLPITDPNKVNVYRNGIRIDFTTIDDSTIELEPEATCYENDMVRIVQFH